MNIENGKWIVPFKGRNHSGATNQNFLWQSKNVYVMDNHRAAMWCWLQHIDPKTQHNIMHIDRHYDALAANLQTAIEACPQWDCTIDEYLNASFMSGGHNYPTIRWDNYLSIYLHEFGDSICSTYFLTHKKGDAPRVHTKFEPEIWELPENMEYWLKQGKGPWIVNIDLDYFFCRFDDEKPPNLMVSENYIESVAKALKAAMDSELIVVVTICLTPDQSYTSGWEETERLASKICALIGHNFKLPKS